MACVFCSIVQGQSPAYVIHDDARSMAFLDLNQATRGHTLVIPKRHADDIWSIEADLFADVARAVSIVSNHLRDRLKPDGITLFQANRRAGWQDVFHLHFHVVPRYAGDGLVRPWISSPDGRDQLSALAQELGARRAGER